jgi:hypothetical protein
MIDSPTTTPANGATDNIDISPPDATQEWIVLGIQNIEANNIDANDTLEIQYMDLVSNKAVKLRSGQRTSYRGGIQAWPGQLGGNLGSADTYQDVAQPLILKTRPNKEAYLQLRFQLATTGTAGARSHSPRVIYRPRPALNI